jgi:predicted MPP superfamily phosphohydrolase
VREKDLKLTTSETIFASSELRATKCMAKLLSIAKVFHVMDNHRHEGSLVDQYKKQALEFPSGVYDASVAGFPCIDASTTVWKGQ